MTCPSFDELSVSFSEGASPELQSHLASCAPCTAAWRDLEALRGAARELPWRDVEPVGGEARLIEAALFSRQAERRRASAVRKLAGLAVAASVAALFLATRREPAPPAPELAPAHVAEARRASVRDADGARFAHSVKASAGVAHDETIELADGSITLEVAPLAVGQRFRVIAPDAEVEVRGTAFTSVVQLDRLVKVAVTSGRVVVRPRGQSEVVLGPGDVWTPSEPPRAPRAAEALFSAGWEALVAGRLAEAEGRLATLARDHASDPLAEDAGYWRAVIAAREGRRADAGALWTSFRARYPGSARAPEAAVMLGWLALEDGDRVRARELFTEGLRASDAEVEGSAREGLARAR